VTTQTLRPQKEKFYIAQLGRDVVMNFITLRDDEWMVHEFTKEKLATAFTAQGFDIDVILAVCWRVLSVEDKKAILAVKVVEEVGMEIKEVAFNTPVEKMKAIISGQAEITAIYAALLNTRLKSNPYLMDDLKKKQMNKAPENLDTTKPLT